MSDQRGELYLNGTLVGYVVGDRWSAPWGFGHFLPLAAFSDYAPLFGMWSVLIHEDDGNDRTSAPALDELRRIEHEIDRLNAHLKWIDPPQSVPLEQLTIDGQLVDWKPRDHQASHVHASAAHLRQSRA